MAIAVLLERSLSPAVAFSPILVSRWDVDGIYFIAFSIIGWRLFAA